jgi:hypothetical protein
MKRETAKGNSGKKDTKVPSKQKEKEKQDKILDKKLENTFPASDSTAEY